MKTNKKMQPTGKWTLERLGSFATDLEKTMAVDAWLMGQTLTLAKEKCKQEGVRFTDWKRKYLSKSDATVSRYMRVFASHLGEEAPERLEELTLSAVYEQVGCDPHAAEKERKATVKTKPKTRRTKTEPQPAWAVKDAFDEEEPADVSLDEWRRSDSLAETLRKDIPWQLQTLSEEVVSLVAEDAVELRKAWPESKRQQKEIAANIEMLLEKLPHLAETLPCVQEMQMSV